MNRHKGAALIAAMLTVALVATLAAAAQWQQWQLVQVEQAQRTRQQAAWILVGAMDWSRLILREDARSNSSDHLSEPWALPLRESRLGTFLGMKDEDTDEADSRLADALLSGQVVDAQSRLNWANIVSGQRLSDPDMADFTRLFQLLGLPEDELDQAAQNYLDAVGGSALSRQGESLAVPPKRWEDLGRLGLSARTLQRLRPHATLLPERTKLNLNTATAETLQAAIEGMDAGRAARMVQLRSQAHFQSLADVMQRLPDLKFRIDDARHSVSSFHFEILGQLQIDGLTLREKTLVRRDGLEVRALWRSTWDDPVL